MNKRADDLHPMFTQLVENYSIPATEGLTHLIKKYTIEVFKKLNERKEVDVEKMQEQVKALEGKLNRLEEHFIEEEITKEMYMKYTEKAKEEKRKMECWLAKAKSRVRTWKTCLNWRLILLPNSSPVGFDRLQRQAKATVHALP